MAQHIFTGSGAPSITPTKVGQHYIDTLNSTTYVSAGTTSSADWKSADASASLAAHVAAADPHAQYLTTAEGNAAYDPINAASAVQTNLNSHTGNTSNPHSTTKAQVGLGSVDNTSDLGKPISTATQTALNLKYDATNPNGYETPAQLNARDTANRSRANHTGTQLAATISDFTTAADARITIQKGAANGLVPLDGTSKIAAVYLPSFVDDVLEFANLAAFPVTGESGKMYVDLATNKTYRWSGSVYVEISPSPSSTDVITEGATNLYFTAARVLSTVLNGISFATNSAIISTDSVLIAFGKLQAQITSILSLKADKTITISAGTGLSGGGDLSADRTISMPNVGTASAYGGASSVPVFTTDAQGRVASVVSTAISIVAAAVTDFAAAVRATVLTGFTVATNSAVVATDSILVAIGKLQAQFNVWNEYVTTAVLTNNSNTTLTNITELAVTVTAGKKYRIESMLLYRSTATGTGAVLTAALSGGAAGTLALIASIPSGVDGIDHVHQGSITASGDLVISGNTPTANLDFCASIEGIFVCTASGTLTPQFRSENNGQTITVQIGSNLIVREF